jgi:nicotinate phosphoribosyltransferase
MLVGTELVTGAGMPTAHLVYKLVAVAEHPGRSAPLVGVAKRSRQKETPPGPRSAWRAIAADGRAVAEVVASADAPPGGVAGAATHRALQRTFIEEGDVVDPPDLTATRARHRAAMAELADVDRDLAPGIPRLDATPMGTAGDQG